MNLHDLEVPYRAVDYEERKELSCFADNLPPLERLEFWKMTVPLAEERAEFLRDHSYILSEMKSWGCVPGKALGANAKIYAPNTDISSFNIEVRQVGVLGYWELEGFRAEPLRIIADPNIGNPQRERVEQFREFLTQHGIPFDESSLGRYRGN